MLRQSLLSQILGLVLHRQKSGVKHLNTHAGIQCPAVEGKCHASALMNSVERRCKSRNRSLANSLFSFCFGISGFVLFVCETKDGRGRIDKTMEKGGSLRWKETFCRTLRETVQSPQSTVWSGEQSFLASTHDSLSYFSWFPTISHHVTIVIALQPIKQSN